MSVQIIKADTLFLPGVVLRKPIEKDTVNKRWKVHAVAQTVDGTYVELIRISAPDFPANSIVGIEGQWAAKNTDTPTEGSVGRFTGGAIKAAGSAILLGTAPGITATTRTSFAVAPILAVIVDGGDCVVRVNSGASPKPITWEVEMFIQFN